MPGAAFHSLFFVNTSTVVPVVIGVQGYPTWQQSPLSLVLGVGLGGAEPVLDILRQAWNRLRWTWRLARQIAGFDPERRRVMDTAVRLIESPAYGSARTAVRMTATTLGLNEPAAWRAISHDLHRKHAWAENAWRHLHACELTEQLVRIDHSTLSNQDRTLVVELAYRGFAQSAVGSSRVSA